MNDKRCTNDVMRLAFKLSGYRLLDKKIAWPRVKAPCPRIDCRTGHVVQFVKQ